jgi:glycosyltransferase involved in cell wall biosynthesis
MRIAFILPSLAQKGPILVVQGIVSYLKDKTSQIDVYYFDDIVEVEFDCPVHKISFSDKIIFDNYEIVHSNMLRPDLYVWKNRRHIKHKITTMHCDIRVDLRYQKGIVASFIFRWIWIFAVRKFDKVVVLTKSILNSYYKRYIKSNNLTYIYNGCREQKDIGIIEKSDEDLINHFKQQGYKIIGANALFTKRKGLHLIIQILKILPDYVFIIAGDGKEKENLQKLSKKLAVDDRCVFLGFKKNAVSFLPFYDVYAMPSYSEGFSMALTEATLMKCSCVCSDIDIFREIFTDEEVTFFKLGNQLSLKMAIEEAYKNRIEKGEKAFQRTIRNYTTEIMGKKYFDLYSSLND